MSKIPEGYSRHQFHTMSDFNFPHKKHENKHIIKYVTLTYDFGQSNLSQKNATHTKYLFTPDFSFSVSKGHCITILIYLWLKLDESHTQKIDAI